MNKEKVTIYVAKYAATDGKVWQYEAEITKGGMAMVKQPGYYTLWFLPRDFSTNQQDAICIAKKKIEAAKKSASKKLAKLMEMEITVICPQTADKGA